MKTPTYTTTLKLNLPGLHAEAKLDSKELALAVSAKAYDLTNYIIWLLVSASGFVFGLFQKIANQVVELGKDAAYLKDCLAQRTSVVYKARVLDPAAETAEFFQTLYQNCYKFLCEKVAVTAATPK